MSEKNNNRNSKNNNKNKNNNRKTEIFTFTNCKYLSLFYSFVSTISIV